MSLETECFSENSDKSKRIILSTESNKNSERAFAVSVFPTPLGPLSKNEPNGLVGSDKPA